MLSEPITQADIDNQTEFQTRSGFIVRVTGTQFSVLYHWVTSQGYSVGDNGRFYEGDIKHHSDLVKRFSAPAAPVTKETNPKDACGISKAPMSTLSSPVMLEIGTAMLEGALKYGRHNYRVVGVRASVYYDAAHRHLAAWWEGEDIDAESGLSHLTKAMATLVVLRDAMIRDKMVDDRPPKTLGFVKQLNEVAAAQIKRYPNPKQAYTELEHGKA